MPGPTAGSGKARCGAGVHRRCPAVGVRGLSAAADRDLAFGRGLRARWKNVGAFGIAHVVATVCSAHGPKAGAALSLRRLGIDVDAARLLPDALLFDAGPGTFWLVEAVYTAGAIDKARKAALVEWASAQNLDPDACRFLSAFVSRTAQPFRQLVGALAWGTHVWFLDEPQHVMRLEDLPERAG